MNSIVEMLEPLPLFLFLGWLGSFDARFHPEPIFLNGDRCRLKEPFIA